MSNKKFVISTIAAAALINLTGVGQAFAVWCQADAPMTYQGMVTQFMPFLQRTVLGTGLSAEESVAQAGAATAGEVTKATLSEITAARALEGARQESQVQQDAVELREKLEQPAGTCSAMATSGSISTATLAVQRDAMQSNKRLVLSRSPAANAGTQQMLDESHQLTNKKFCTPAEKALKICEVNETGPYRNLAGADQDAAFMFQGPDGARSYEGDGTAQAEAVDSFIKRIAGGVPMDALPGKTSAYYANNPAARAYVELARRYNSMTSVAEFSMAQIRAATQVRPGLGRDTQMANIDVEGFTKGKNDMSMVEAVDRFVATRFSPATIANLTTARSSATILRDMAQTSNFQLWMAFQAQQRAERTEALMGHQLALMADQNLRPQIEAQRKAALSARAAQR